MKKIGIVGGAGNLGAMIAYNIALENLAEEIVLIDIMEEKASAQAADINHSMAWEQEVEIYQGDYEDAEEADLFVITAGKPRKPGMSRLDLIDSNKSIIKNIAEKIGEYAPDSITVTTTNPIDVINFALYHYGNRPKERVIGEAGMLDSARFRYVLSKRFRIKMPDVEAYIIGEHGDSQVPLFSQIKVEGKKRTINSEKEQKKILSNLKRSAMDVIEGKGATIFGPARGVTLMIKSILKNEEKVYPCSVIPDGEYGLRGGSIGLPAKLGANGIEDIIEWDIKKEETKMLKKSHQKIREICDKKIRN